MPQRPAQTHFFPALCHSGKLSLAWPGLCLVGSGPAQQAENEPGLSSAYLNYHFPSGWSPQRKCENTSNSPEEFKHNLHTCKMQIWEHLQKAMSFNVDLSKLLLEEAWCIPSLEKMDNAILPLHSCFDSAPYFNYNSTFRT